MQETPRDNPKNASCQWIRASMFIPIPVHNITHNCAIPLQGILASHPRYEQCLNQVQNASQCPRELLHTPNPNDYRFETFLIGRPPPPSSCGSTVLNPLARLLFVLGLLSGLCSSKTSTISSSGSLTLSSTTMVSSRVRLLLSLLGTSTSITSLADLEERDALRCRVTISSSTIRPPPHRPLKRTML